MDLTEARASFRRPRQSDYPELANYSRDDIYDGCLGPGGLYLAVRMLRTMALKPGDVVLDLGCGQGTTSVYLAGNYGVRVIAVDLWTPASALHRKIAERGYRDRIVPLNLDITGRLPFAGDYFDAIFCMNSFSFYGGSHAFLRHLLPHLRTGGLLCIGSEVLTDEFTAEQLADPPHVYAFRLPPPNEHVDVFEDDFKKQHTPGWWKDLFESSGMLEVTDCHVLEDADVLYEDLTLFEDEHDLYPDDVAILLEQIEWGRRYRPAKTVFTITARKL